MKNLKLMFSAATGNIGEAAYVTSCDCFKGLHTTVIAIQFSLSMPSFTGMSFYQYFKEKDNKLLKQRNNIKFATKLEGKQHWNSQNVTLSL
jgi:hypothetical protein